MHSWVSGQGKRLLAIALIGLAYWFSRSPHTSEVERNELASRFQFESLTLPEVAGPEMRHVRPVHPSLDHISAWISAVGASVALADLDGDERANDVCYVDTRTDQIIVAPVPGTSPRYEPFTLVHGDDDFDRRTMAPTGCIPGDLNEDGWTDILAYYWGRPPLAFLRTVEDGESGRLPRADCYVPCEVVSEQQRWYTNAATRADVDGDGHIDLVIGNYFQDGARILDAKAGGVEHMHASMSRAFNAGRNRLLLWQGATAGDQPSVRFREAKGALDQEHGNVATGWTLAIGAADLDGDMLPELYFSNDFGPDRLLHNRSTPGVPQLVTLSGPRHLTTPRSKVLGHDSFKGMGVDFGDLNGDGQLDIYVSNIAAEYALEESHFAFVSNGPPDSMQRGVAPYVDRSESLGLSRSGWGWESRLADFDNDGVLEAVQATGFAKGTTNRWPELHEIAMGNDQLLTHTSSWHRFQPGDDLSGHDHNPFFARDRTGRFVDISAQLDLNTPQVTRGIATADVDHDGDLDFAIGNQWEASRFYRNECPEPGAFLGLRLLLPIQGEASEGLVVNSSVGRSETRQGNLRGWPAIGASAIVHLPGERGRIVAQVDGGNGHSGTRSPELHIGLGDVSANAQLDVDLRWRDAGGRVRNETIQVTPGWHTVQLPSGRAVASEPMVAARTLYGEPDHHPR